jgi:hypothetical protein
MRRGRGHLTAATARRSPARATTPAAPHGPRSPRRAAVLRSAAPRTLARHHRGEARSSSAMRATGCGRGFTPLRVCRGIHVCRRRPCVPPRGAHHLKARSGADRCAGETWREVVAVVIEYRVAPPRARHRAMRFAMRPSGRFPGAHPFAGGRDVGSGGLRYACAPRGRAGVAGSRRRGCTSPWRAGSPCGESGLIAAAVQAANDGGKPVPPSGGAFWPTPAARARQRAQHARHGAPRCGCTCRRRSMPRGGCAPPVVCACPAGPGYRCYASSRPGGATHARVRLVLRARCC